jgi:hypothetical protein
MPQIKTAPICIDTVQVDWPFFFWDFAKEKSEKLQKTRY